MNDQKDTIARIKELADLIQSAKLGERGKEAHINSYVVIDEYHEWRTLTEELFDQFFDTSNAKYQKFQNLPDEGNGHVLMSSFNQQYPIFKLLINKIEGGKIKPIKSKKVMNEIEIFISHASKDKEIIDAFVDIILQGGLSIPIDKIFCVSTDGTRIKSGEDWRNSIKEALVSAKINFLVITPNYKESEVCMNEMGASWVTTAHVLPLIVEPINYSTVGVIHQPTQIEKLLDEGSLDRIKDLIQEQLAIPNSQIKSDRWTTKKKEFLLKVKKSITTNPFSKPLDRKEFEKLIAEKADLETTIENLIDEKADLETLVSDLKLAKDKKEVSKILKRKKISSQFEEFQELCSEVSSQLDYFDPVIRGIIFKSYTNKDVKIDWQINESIIKEAVADDYVDEDMDADFETTKRMRNLYESLEKISHYMGIDLDMQFDDEFQENYDAPFKLSNRNFWEEVFDVAIDFK